MIDVISEMFEITVRLMEYKNLINNQVGILLSWKTLLSTINWNSEQEQEIQNG